MSAIDLEEVNLNIEIPVELYNELETESKRLGLPVKSTVNKIICDRYMNMSIKDQEYDFDDEARYSEDLYQAKISDRGLWVVLITGIVLIGSLTFASLSL